MKVKDYLVNRILELENEKAGVSHCLELQKNKIDELNEMINAQHDTIERLEKHGEEYRDDIDHINGILCEVRQIISDNMLRELPDYHPLCISIGEGGTDSEKSDFDKLLELLDLKEDQMKDNDNKEVPDEVPED